MDRATTIIPGRGLGNRLLSIAITHLLHESPSIGWYVNHECRAEWEDLFTAPTLDIYPCNENDYRMFADRFNSIKSIKEKMHNILSSSYNRAEKPASLTSFYQSLKPSKKVNKYILDIPTNTLGLHLRLSDHLQMQSESYYLDRVQKLYNDLGSPKVFICSDTQFKKNELVKLFPEDKVIINYTILSNTIKAGQESRDRNLLGGMQLATSEMFTLSKCTWIAPNSVSSFSMSSFFMGDAKLL
jgi:hypothetical protein